MNLDGSLPLMVWARPTKTGERVWLWIRAGSSGDDIENVLSYIAPACYARSARLHRTRKLATLVAVDIIRRDPLTTSKPVVSPLTHLASDTVGEGEGTEPIKATTVFDITSMNTDLANQHRKTSKSGSKDTASSPTVVIGGEDLSDYVD